MDPETSPQYQSLFQEARTDTECPLGSVIQIQASQPSTFSVRQRPTRRILRSQHVFDTQAAFQHHYLATSASIYHAKAAHYPRSFLWRVVNNQKVLELRSVDLSKLDDELRDACYTIQLCFDAEIKHGGVALADTEDRRLINVFVLTRANELYTFTIRKEVFCSLSASEEDTTGWCKIARPATFSISPPYCLVATSAFRLLCSLSDGRLLILSRDKGPDCSYWNEKIYGDGHWTASLRGLVRWQGSNTLNYDGNTLDQTTPLTMVESSDGNYVFAVCANHTLRVWNPGKGGAVFSKDLLWEQRDQHEIPKMMLDPASPNVLQILKMSGSQIGHGYYVVTFSPHDYGQFKFWGIRDPDAGENGIQDLFPEATLKPPDPDPSPNSKAIWKVADFKTIASEDRNVNLWLLLQSNRHYRLYNLQCRLEELDEQWDIGWTTTSLPLKTDYDIPQSLRSDQEDPSQKWLDYILQPGNFSQSLLENALMIYCVNRGLSPGDAKTSFTQRLRSTVEYRVKNSLDKPGIESYRAASHQEWSIFWQDVRDLDRSRFTPTSLALDERMHMPWIVFADGCSAVRTSDNLETWANNNAQALSRLHPDIVMPSVEDDAATEQKLPDQLAAIIGVATYFKEKFSSRLEHNFGRALDKQLWLESSMEMSDRLERIHDECDFTEEIEDGVFDDLANNKFEHIGGIQNLDNEAFFAIIGSFSHQLPEHSSKLAFSQFGIKAVIKEAHEMISKREVILCSLLALAVFIDTEVDRNETSMDYFDGTQVLPELLLLLKRYQVLRWLVTHNTFDGVRVPKNRNEIDWKPTVLESLFAVDLKPQGTGSQSSCKAFTHTVEDLLQWAILGNEPPPWENLPVHIQSFLLVHKNVRLALDFLHFLPSTASAKYLKGRLALLRQEVDEAAGYFQASAEELATPDPDIKALGPLLKAPEAANFGRGPPRYFMHIIDLFNAADPPSPSHVTHFAQLALQHGSDSPIKKDLNAKLLSSLFTASLKIEDFIIAHSALTRHPSPDTLLPNFITRILETPKQTPQLLDFRWSPNLQRQIDALLVEKVAAELDPESREKIRLCKILSAWRLRHDDFQGAARPLLPSLYNLQKKSRRTKADDRRLENEYLIIINLLASAGKDKAWVLAGGTRGEENLGKERQLITVEDLREQYQSELDRRSVIDGGRYAFVGNGFEEGDEMEL